MSLRRARFLNLMPCTLVVSVAIAEHNNSLVSTTTAIRLATLSTRVASLVTTLRHLLLRFRRDGHICTLIHSVLGDDK